MIEEERGRSGEVLLRIEVFNIVYGWGIYQCYSFRGIEKSMKKSQRMSRVAGAKLR